GSEIRTPNLDGLAQHSMKLTNFHVAPTCAPTRSIFLSGADNHTAGLGSMFGPNMLTGVEGQPGYEMYLHERVATIPELLTDAGYHTYVAGKWHLGELPEQSPGARGFENYFTLLPGSATQFVARAGQYEENGVRLDTDIEDFYSTEVHTDKLIEYIGANRGDGQPFFAFAAYTSPHWPLQVPDDYLDRYAGRYDDGYDVLRRERVQRAQSLGVVPNIDAEAVFSRMGSAWDELDEETQRISAREMEIYAAMVENLDFHIGRLITHLAEIDELDNTVIVFMSDNGAESDELELNPTFAQRYIVNADNSYENLGRVDSFISYGPGWAQASTAPFRGAKGLVNEGGTRVPAFIFDGRGDLATGIDNQYLRVMDLSATLLELADAELPGDVYRGREVAEMAGRSFTGLLSGNHEPIYDENEAIGLELHGGKTLRRGRYKLVWEQPPGNTWWPYTIPDTWYRWQLYDIESDPAESNDLSAEQPELLAEMISLWEEFADDHGVVRDVRIKNYERWHPE
ncbi:MAG: arylsulfatase, partial [Candidatus Rariloculaceae bacterium]